MGVYLNPGNDAFRRARRSRIYIDKSELIAYTNSVLDTEKQYLCVSRPRRFGKSMAANMLCAYYSRDCASGELFQSLKIAEQKSYSEYLNQYHVIFLIFPQFLRAAGSPGKLADYIEEKVAAEIREMNPEYAVISAENLPELLAGVYARERGEKKALFLSLTNGTACSGRRRKTRTRRKDIWIF